MLSGNASDSNSGENDEPNKIGNGSCSKFCSNPRAHCNQARAGTSAQNNLSEHGATRSVPDGGPKCRDCLGSKRGTGCHIERCKDSGPRAPWLRNCRRREERFCMCCGASMDVPFRRSGVLEPQNSRPYLFQSAGRAIRFTDYLQENRNGISRANQG